MEKLETEKFDTLKELASLQSNLALGRAELKKLKETTEEYMQIREKEAEERVVKVLKKSHEALEATTTNHSELSGYNKELQAYAGEIKGLTTDIIALSKDFNERMDIAEKDMEKNNQLVSDILTGVKIERVNMREDRKQLERERKETSENMRILKDRQETLKRGFEELKKLQGKLK